jgi:hypothetical protein
MTKKRILGYLCVPPVEYHCTIAHKPPSPSNKALSTRWRHHRGGCICYIRTYTCENVVDETGS